MNKEIKTVAAASLLSVSGSIVYLISPIIIGSAMDSLKFNSSESGYMLSFYFAGYTLISASAIYWLPKINSRIVAFYATISFVISLLIAAIFTNYTIILIMMLISGAGAGILYGLSIAVIAETDQPDKNYGIALASQLIFGSILLFLGPSLIIPTWGLSGLFIGTAIFVAFIGACLPWMPAQLEQSAIEGESNILNTTNVTALFAIAALFIWFTGLSAIYAFVERIGSESGIDSLMIGIILSFTIITGVSGALSATFFGKEISKLRQHIFSSIGILVAINLLISVPGLYRYFIAICLLTYFWNLWLAFFLGTIAEIDTGNRYPMLTTVALGLGATFGPGIAGSLVKDQTFDSLFIFSNLMIAMSLIMIIYPVIIKNRSMT
jgi:predicted MFS family arabinose efflux permease